MNYLQFTVNFEIWANIYIYINVVFKSARDYLVGVQQRKGAGWTVSQSEDTERFLLGQIFLMFLNAAMLMFGKSFVAEQLFTPVLWLTPVRISTG